MSLFTFPPSLSLYDLECEMFLTSSELQTWIEIVRCVQPRSILEVGGGTGRIALHVLNNVQGVTSYTLVDLDANSLEKAMGKPFPRSVDVRAIHSDIRDMIQTQSYDLILLGLNTISEFTREGGLSALFAQLAKMLSRLGIVAFDMLIPPDAIFDLASASSPFVQTDTVRLPPGNASAPLFSRNSQRVLHPGRLFESRVSLVLTQKDDNEQDLEAVEQRHLFLKVHTERDLSKAAKAHGYKTLYHRVNGEVPLSPDLPGRHVWVLQQE